MPTSIAIVLAIAGAVLIVVGAMGGGFTLAAATVPAVGVFPRVLSFCVGAALIATSMYVFREESNKAEAQDGPGVIVVPQPASTPGQVTIYNAQSPPAPDSSTGSDRRPFPAPIVAPEGYDINIYWGLDSSAPVVASLPHGYQVQILCTAQGASVTRSDGVTSSLWDGVSIGEGVGGFVPDVYVYTGTEQPVMPNCADS
jgi:hypothetical protein